MRINRQTNSLQPESTGGREREKGVHSPQPDKVSVNNEKNLL